MADNLDKETLAKLGDYTKSQRVGITHSYEGDNADVNWSPSFTDIGGSRYQGVYSREGNPTDAKHTGFMKDIGGGWWEDYDAEGNYKGKHYADNSWSEFIKAASLPAMAYGAHLAGVTGGMGAAGAGAAEGAGAAGLTELGVEGSALLPGEVAQTGLTEPGFLNQLGSAASSGVEGLKGLASEYLTPGNMLKYGLPVLGVLGASGNKQAAATAPQMSESQKAYFNKSTTPWDWEAIRAAASRAGMPVSSFVSRNWNRMNSGEFNQQQPAAPVKLAQGGGLGMMQRLAQGSADGREDNIDAKLSPGEFVMDAETVSMLGNGNNAAGAQKLDQMREALRRHKGQALSQGKFSADAKSPLEYMKGRK